ncbi:MAG: hypothetical protein QNJ51_23030 [Calothrix sp. MO_167.B12]|nr:hypothetical protein [Calothrix sp. MO_167.B12]
MVLKTLFFVTSKSGLKLRVTIGGWCVTLSVSLLPLNIFAASENLYRILPPLQKKYASWVNDK